MVLSEWTAAIEAQATDCLSELLGIEAIGQNVLAHESATAFPGVLILWGSRLVGAGLLAMPGQPPQAWPGVLVENGQATTVSSDARTLLPAFLLHRRLTNAPSNARKLGEAWPVVADACFGLHAALGGERPALETLAAVLQNSVAREEFKRSDDRLAFELAHSRLMRRIDPSPSFIAFADWFDARLAGKDHVFAPEAYGAWCRQALSWSHIFDLSVRGGSEEPEMLIPLLEGFAGLDTGLLLKPSWSWQNGGSSETLLVEVASLTDSDSALLDDVQQGLVKTLVSAGTSYDGSDHASATVVLDERGEPDRAWTTLNAAAWWMALRYGEAPAAITDGAHLLCDEHGWEDIRWVVDRAMKGTT
ncbi:hypothetical protein [Sphingomonas bacterium]|uniref:hypothetical protein n=1 Tax=Sphingomonas bacterium TaxID=1895847 RepID=UPI00261B68C1|nr:hypothetical protein [Sphingomonas bacterium]MDB5678537.1 hypothetical protein [Sphingomonas bacterium]